MTRRTFSISTTAKVHRTVETVARARGMSHGQALADLVAAGLQPQGGATAREAALLVQAATREHDKSLERAWRQVGSARVQAAEAQATTTERKRHRATGAQAPQGSTRTAVVCLGHQKEHCYPCEETFKHKLALYEYDRGMHLPKFCTVPKPARNNHFITVQLPTETPGGPGPTRT